MPGLELNGRFKFVALRPSGVVVSERALKQARRCPQRHASDGHLTFSMQQAPAAVAELLGGPALATQAVIALNGTAEEVEALRLADAAAKASRKKKRATEASDKPVKQAAAVDAKPQRVTGASDRAKEDACAAAKRYKAAEHMPAGATAAVWSSIFTSSSVDQRAETFGARSLSFRR